MARNTQYYSQKDHQVVVTAGGASTPLTDFDADESISWEPMNTDQVTVTEGFDGAKVSLASGRAGKITVKLKPTSPQVGYLTKLYNSRLQDAPVICNVTISTGVKEKIVLTNAFVSMAGGATGGPTMSSREFSFVGETLQMDES